MIKKASLILTLVFSFSLLNAAEGDTTIIRSHDKTLMKFPDPDNNRRYHEKINFPSASIAHRKVLLAYTLECPSSGCSSWDYDTHVSIIESTGTLDSNMIEDPYFTVDGVDLDSFYIHLTPTYVTFFDSINQITDSIFSDSLFVEEFRNASNPSQVTNSFYSFDSEYYNYYHDATGVIIDSNYVMGDSIWHQSYHVSYSVFEVKNTIEIARLITPYGEYSAGDHYPYTTYFEVTDYAPLMHDSTEIQLRFSGWQNGFLATLDFLFIEGTPERTAKRVLHNYDGSYSYGSTNNPINPRLAPYSLSLESGETFAQLNYTVTGHGADGNNCSEFCEKDYIVKVNGSTKYTKSVWKDDCGKNPIIGQNGTWVYNRANWCPGLPGYTDKHDLTPHLSGGTDEIKVDFENYTNSGSASYKISSNIVTFGPANFSLDASIERIMSPNNDWSEYQHNPICGDPKIVIKNTGSQELTKLLIVYGCEGGKEKHIFWTGNLKFLESEVVSLPRPYWERTKNKFIVRIAEPNDGVDEYASNNVLVSNFDTPKVLPNDLIVFYKTDNFSAMDNKLSIKNYDGDVVYSKNSAQNNFNYEDELNLETGCYSMKLTDVGFGSGNGIGWRYYSAAGTGSLSFRDGSTQFPIPLHTFNTDFGAEINYQFMVGVALGTEDARAVNREFEVFPNPSSGVVFIQGPKNSTVESVAVYDQIGKKIDLDVAEVSKGRFQFDGSALSKGVYFIELSSDYQKFIKKVIIQ